MESQKSRSQLFEECVVQLDSAAGESREQGNEELATYIEDTLISFLENEALTAALEEMRE